MGWSTALQRRAAKSAIMALFVALFTVLSAATAIGATAVTRASATALVALGNVAHKITAYDGYVVLSQYEPVARDWRLVAWHDGAIAPLNALPRDMPFDADAGPAANGSPVVVYSRCTQDPPAGESELAGSAYLRMPNWTEARGCRIYELALPNGSPKLVQGIHAQGVSDSTPAIWKGNVAFARLAAGSHVEQVYLWRRSHQTLAHLGGGQRPCSRSEGSCARSKGVAPAAWVSGMTLDGSVLGYEWATSTATFGESPFPELRADPLRDLHQSGPSQVIGERFVSGTCGFVEGVSPGAVGGSLLYTTISGDCRGGSGNTEEIGSTFDSYSTKTRRWRSAGGGPGVVAALAEDGSKTYWISDVPKPPTTIDPTIKCRPGYVACFEPVFQQTQDCALAHGSCPLMESGGRARGDAKARNPGRRPYPCQADRRLPAKPTGGLEPPTPSLRVNDPSSVSACVLRGCWISILHPYCISGRFAGTMLLRAIRVVAAA